MAAEYNVQAIMDDLRKIGDLNPDQHDGSYELMKETIQAYSEMSDYSPLDYRDLNLVYLTTVGTWKQSISSKKKTIDDSHLSSQAKQRLKALWDIIWQKAEMGEYTNNEPDASGHRGRSAGGSGEQRQDLGVRERNAQLGQVRYLEMGRDQHPRVRAHGCSR